LPTDEPAFDARRLRVDGVVFCANCEAFIAIKSRAAFDIYLPPLASQQDTNSTLPVSNANISDRFEARSQCDITIATHGSVPHCTTIDA
jgi:hypothetical protein